MNKTDVRVKRTYKQLLDSFMELIGEKEFDDLTVCEICERANVHRATFYKHFNDKYEFLDFCFVNSLSEIELKEIEFGTTPEGIKNSFMYFIREVFEYVKKNKLIFTIAFSMTHYSTVSNSFAAAVEAFCFDKIKIVLPDETKESLEIFSRFYSYAFMSVIRWYSENKSDYPLEKIYSFFEHRVDELCSSYEKTYYSVQ